jgi:hypothetical protein
MCSALKNLYSIGCMRLCRGAVHLWVALRGRLYAVSWRDTFISEGKSVPFPSLL